MGERNGKWQIGKWQIRNWRRTSPWLKLRLSLSPSAGRRGMGSDPHLLPPSAISACSPVKNRRGTHLPLARAALEPVPLRGAAGDGGRKG